MWRGYGRNEERESLRTEPQITLSFGACMQTQKSGFAPPPQQLVFLTVLTTPSCSGLAFDLVTAIVPYPTAPPPPVLPSMWPRRRPC